MMDPRAAEREQEVRDRLTTSERVESYCADLRASAITAAQARAAWRVSAVLWRLYILHNHVRAGMTNTQFCADFAELMRLKRAARTARREAQRLDRRRAVS